MEGGALGVRQYTARDVAILIAIRHEYAAKRKTSQIKDMLRAGSLQTKADGDDAPNGSDTTTVPAIAEVPASHLIASITDLSSQMSVLVQASLQAITDHQEAFLRQHQNALNELREERRALEALRAEIASERTAEVSSLETRQRHTGC